MEHIEKQFTELGGKFITSYANLKEKVAKIKAVIFDWDGVFNNGLKISDVGSAFSEPDTMGMNMFKLDYWLRNRHLPYTFIITGENNQMALKIANREKMNAVFLSYINKTEALNIICDKYGLKKEEVAFMYDDILDIGVAKEVGVSILISRSGSPLTTNYVISNGICDYVTGNPGGEFAVREVCELLIGTNGDMSKTIDTRIRFKGDYEKYLAERGLIETQLIRFGE